MGQILALLAIISSLSILFAQTLLPYKVAIARLRMDERMVILEGQIEQALNDPLNLPASVLADLQSGTTPLAWQLSYSSQVLSEVNSARCFGTNGDALPCVSDPNVPIVWLSSWLQQVTSGPVSYWKLHVALSGGPQRMDTTWPPIENLKQDWTPIPARLRSFLINQDTLVADSSCPFMARGFDPVSRSLICWNADPFVCPADQIPQGYTGDPATGSLRVICALPPPVECKIGANPNHYALQTYNPAPVATPSDPTGTCVYQGQSPAISIASTCPNFYTYDGVGACNVNVATVPALKP